MISFACQDIEFKDLLRCSFELNKTEYNVLIFLLRCNQKLDAQNIGEKLKLDRTTIQKAIKKLAEKNLVIRQQTNLEKGGYTFHYFINNKENIKQRMRNIVNNWHEQVLKEIDNW